MRWPEKQLVSVEAAQEYYEPIRPVEADVASPPAMSLDIGVVLGKHRIDTSLAGPLTIDADRSSAALEVMSRFAVDPRWLAYLPPTMAPAATSERPDYLEHPDEAFKYFRSTGRPFFAESEVTSALLGRIRTAVDASGLWDRLGTDWLILDSELLPWSAKSTELLRNQYAATGAAGTATLDAAQRLMSDATQRGIELDALATGTHSRAEHVGSFVEACRQGSRPSWCQVQGTRVPPDHLRA